MHATTRTLEMLADMTPAKRQKLLRACRSSIKHWQRMRRSTCTKEEPNCDYCALCKFSTFFNQPRPQRRIENISCCYCPIAWQGYRGCVGSPFVQARDAWVQVYEACSEDVLAAWKASATKEIKFLEEILATVTLAIGKVKKND